MKAQAAPVSPQPELTPSADRRLSWLKGTDAYFLISADGRYTVCRAYSAKVITYQAWRRGWPPQLLGTFLHQDAAKDCAAKHSMGGA